MKNLVISSGGINILCLVGSLKYLNNNNLLNNVKCYFGISAGAILCTMLALDYTIDEIIDFFKNMDFLKFLGKYDVTNFINNYGLSYGESRDIIAQSFIIYKLGEKNKDYTFKQLYDDKKKELHLFCVCVEDKTLWTFSHNSNENVPIWKAMAASCNIPFIFTPFNINNNTFIDGAIINAYPINYVDDINDTIGLFISNHNNNIDYLDKIPNLKYYLEILFLYLTFKTHYSYKNTINIILPEKYKNYTYKFDISDEDKNILIDIGYNLTKNHYNIKASKKILTKKIVKNLKRSNSCIF
jgi:predicted acylesterase/phospholipase RssA